MVHRWEGEAHLGAGCPKARHLVLCVGGEIGRYGYRRQTVLKRVMTRRPMFYMVQEMGSSMTIADQILSFLEVGVVNHRGIWARAGMPR